MLEHIHIEPLAAESLGVRSMCTYVETSDAKILLDAGVSLAPNRFGLPPHPLEFKAIVEARKRIAQAADDVEVVTLSHYHFDHHTPSYEDWLSNWTARDETARQIYEGKTVLIKNPRENINYSQRRRAWMFQRTGGRYAKKLEVADAKTFLFGKDTVVKFSEPVFHGPEDSALGWVLMATIKYRSEKFMFAPDVQGPTSARTLEIINEEKPQLIMLGGPPLYLSGFRVDENQIQAGLGNLEKVVKIVPSVILEHHVLRNEDWRENVKSVFDMAREAGCEILTGAEFISKENAFLEAKRKKLFSTNPPSSEFEKWMHKSVDVQKHLKPPI